MGQREEAAALHHLEDIYREFLDAVRLHSYANPEIPHGSGRGEPARVLEQAAKMESVLERHQLDTDVLSKTFNKMYEVLMKNGQSAAAALLAKKYNL